MKSLTRLQKIALIGMVAIGLLGGGALIYLSMQFGSAQNDVQNADDSLHKLVGERYLPSQENTEALQKNNDLLKEGIEVLQQRLQASGNKLGDVSAKNPVVFKQELAENLRGLTEMAAKNGVKIDAGAANFGFSSYQNNNPTEAATVVLAKQLIGIHEIVAALFNAHIGTLNAVRRTFDENGPSAVASSGGESLAGKIGGPAQGLYVAYPLEVEFTGSEESFRKVLANLADDPYVLVVRYPVITSSRLTPPHVADVLPGIESAERKPTFAVVMGDDDLHIRLRIDLIDWTGKPSGAKK